MMTKVGARAVLLVMLALVLGFVLSWHLMSEVPFVAALAPIGGKLWYDREREKGTA